MFDQWSPLDAEACINFWFLSLVTEKLRKVKFYFAVFHNPVMQISVKKLSSLLACPSFVEVNIQVFYNKMSEFNERKKKSIVS